MNKIVLALLLLLMLVVSPLYAADEASVKDSIKLLRVFQNSKISGKIKLLWFFRDFYDDKTDWSTLALGGNLNFETASFHGFSAGVGFKTGHGNLAENDNKDVYRGLLALGDSVKDGKGYSALDEYYIRYNRWETSFTLGAHQVVTPWLRNHDIRLTPKKYKGFSLINKKSIEMLELYGYYLTEWLDWTSDTWESIAIGITDNPSDNEDALIGGLIWRPRGSLKIQFWDYYFQEVMNDFYVHANYNIELHKDVLLSVDLKYLNRNDVGDKLKGEIATYMVGGNMGISAYGATLTVYYGSIGNVKLLTPFGNVTIIRMQSSTLSRALENAWAIKLKYKFNQVGIKGLSAYIFYANYSTPNYGENVSPDKVEVDFNIQYKFSGCLKNCSIRLKHAIVDQDEEFNGRDWTDLKVFLQYSF